MFDTNSVIYQVFVRNYSQDGSFVYLEKDLKRIKDLGVDIIYLTPINEIGQKNRKGNWGSPYASKDYYSISHDLGTKEDLISLINKTHELGMKIILDMVFNHTAPDSVLFKKHPEFYFYKDGKPGNRIGDWSDIIDLDTSREDTQDYLIEVLSKLDARDIYNKLNNKILLCYEPNIEICHRHIVLGIQLYSH